MEGTSGKHIVLILARELAVNIATPLFIIDANGTLVFFNEPAERLLGQPFRATGELAADRWAAMFTAESADGTPLSAEDRPLSAALTGLRPTHRTLVITGADKVARRLVVTAYPLMADSTRAVGAIAIFWEAGETDRAWEL